MSVARIDQPRTPLLVEILPFTVHTDTKRESLTTRFLAALAETRRQEAGRVIDRYSHLIDDKKRG